MEMSTADVFKRSINKLHVPFWFELQGFGFECCDVHLIVTPVHHATCCRFAFEICVALRARVMLHTREGDIEWGRSKFDHSLT